MRLKATTGIGKIYPPLELQKEVGGKWITVGYMIVSEDRNLCILIHIYVDPIYRGKGYGTKMISLLQGKKVKKIKLSGIKEFNGFKQIVTEVATEDGKKLLLKCGFTKKEMWEWVSPLETV